MSTLHFWPEDIASDLPTSPLTVLKEAASELGQATKGALEAEVLLGEKSNQHWAGYDLILNVKPIGFRYALLRLGFAPTSFYPCMIFFEDEEIELHDEHKVREALTNILHSEPVVKKVRALLAQSLVG